MPALALAAEAERARAGAARPRSSASLTPSWFLTSVEVLAAAEVACARGRWGACRRSGCRTAGRGSPSSSWPPIGRSCSAENQPWQRRRHRVVRGRRARPRRAGGRTARRGRCSARRGAPARSAPPPAQEGGDGRRRRAARRRRHRDARRGARRPAGAPARRLLLGIGRAVDQPQERLDALVERVDAEERRGDLERRQRLRRSRARRPRQRDGARSTRSQRRGRLGGHDPPRRAARPPRGSSGRISDAAAAATTAPQPASSQPNVRRSPRKASHTARRGRALVGIVEPAERDRAGDRVRDDDRDAGGGQRRPRAATPFARRSRDSASAATAAASVERREQPGRDADVARDARRRARRASRCPAWTTTTGRLSLDLGARAAGRSSRSAARDDRADVGERQRDRVLGRARRPPGARRAPRGGTGCGTRRRRRARDGRRDERPRGEQVGLVAQHDAVGHALADHRAHARDRAGSAVARSAN